MRGEQREDQGLEEVELFLRLYFCITFVSFEDGDELKSLVTVELSRTKLQTLPPLVLGGIIENQNSDFVIQ